MNKKVCVCVNAYIINLILINISLYLIIQKNFLKYDLFWQSTEHKLQ